jgi:hypothetical protein
VSDNFHITVWSSGKEHFAAAMKIAFANCPGRAAKMFKIHEAHSDKAEWEGGYTPHPGHYFSVFWHDDRSVQGILPLPYEMKAEPMTELIWEWLQNAKALHGPPDHDGDNSRGFFLTTGDTWGHFAGSHYHVVSVCPDWMWHGK